ncbi:hypothetical protein Emed_001381 [Eimeria media]
MTSSSTSRSQAHDFAIGDFSIESTSSSKPQESHGGRNSAVYRPLRKASELVFYKSFFTVSVVSIALVYLMIQCIHQVSLNRGLRIHTRSLATGGSGGGHCFTWPQEGEAEDPPSDENEHHGGAQETRSATSGRRRRREAQKSSGRETRRLAPRWHGRIRHLVGSIEELATNALSLLPSLAPEDAVTLSMKLSMLAAGELATLAYIPEDSQALRVQAGGAYNDLIRKLLDMESTRAAACNMDLETKLNILGLFHEELAGEPSAVPGGFRNYKSTIIACWRTSNFTVAQAAAQLNSLHLEASQGIVPSDKVQEVCDVLEAIFKTRKKQLLASQTIGHWFVSCHRRLGFPFLYTPQEYEEAQSQGPSSSMNPSDQISEAIVAAGGTVVSVEVRESETDPQQSSDKSPTTPDADTDSAQSPPPSEPPLPGPSHAAPAVQPPQQPPQPGTSTNWEALGARPHGGVTCSQILPSLFPQQAAMVAKLLSMVVALQLTTLAYLPAILQPSRAAVGASYRFLIGKILADPATLQAATLMDEASSEAPLVQQRGGPVSSAEGQEHHQGHEGAGVACTGFA